VKRNVFSCLLKEASEVAVVTLLLPMKFYIVTMGIFYLFASVTLTFTGGTPDLQK